MADLVMILAGPAVALAAVVGYLLGQRSNVQRQVDALLARETALPSPILFPPAGKRFEEDLAAFKTIERFRMDARQPGRAVVGEIVPVAEPPSEPAGQPSLSPRCRDSHLCVNSSCDLPACQVLREQGG